MAKRTLNLLESLHIDRQMSVDQLNALVAAKVPEDQFLDYKDGRELVHAKKARRTLRQYMSGFANSDGGVLIIGVNDQDWKVTGCPAPGGGDLNAWGGDLAEWASSCVMPIASLFSQRPEFCVVDHPHGKVLAAWTARSLSLVDCNEGGKSVYYLRLHDKTLRAPDYLISDLLLGRREHPYLQVSDIELHSFDLRDRDYGKRLSLRNFLNINLEFLIENAGLSWSDSVMIGLIGYADPPHGHMSQYLRSAVEIHEPEIDNYSGGMSLSHQSAAITPDMAPFTSERAVLGFSLPTDTHDATYIPYVWDAAVYLLSKGAPPIWYRLRLNIDFDVRLFASGKKRTPDGFEFWETERLPAGRPVVAWHKMNRED